MALSLMEAIARVPQWASKSIATTSLGGGITNQNYRVDVNDEPFVLRICGDTTDLLGINRDAEFIANRAAGELGIAPKVYHRIEPENYLVTHFIDGRPIAPAEMGKPTNIRRVANALKKFHSLDLNIPATFSPFRRVEHLTQVSRSRGAHLPANFDWFIARMHEVETAFRADPFVPRPCHDDLLNANFLDNGQIHILDWEYAGMGDLFFDLANFASHHRFNDDQARELLKAYFGDVTPRRLARLRLMRPMSELHEAMWGTAQTRLSQLDFDFRGYADLWFERAAQAIQDSRWSQWLTEMTHG